MGNRNTAHGLKYRKKFPERWNDYKRRNNDVSRLRAFAEGTRWSSVHIDMVKSWTGTDRELALMIGRSAAAIKMLRVRHELVRPVGSINDTQDNSSPLPRLSQSESQDDRS